MIAASNEPQKIDKAIRRVGRFDKTIFVPPPDFEARKELFKMALKGRYTDPNIDLDLLAKMTENYTAVEIEKSIIREAAKDAMEKRVPISQNHLTSQLQKTKPQLSNKVIESYKNKIDF